MLVPASLADLACMAAIAGDEATAAAAIGEARAALGARRRAVTAAALRYAEGIMAWHRRTGRTGSLTGSDRQTIWRVTHRHGRVGWVAQLVLSCG
jgi:hypothetical protein